MHSVEVMDIIYKCVSCVVIVLTDVEADEEETATRCSSSMYEFSSSASSINEERFSTQIGSSALGASMR